MPSTGRNEKMPPTTASNPTGMRIQRASGWRSLRTTRASRSGSSRSRSLNACRRIRLPSDTLPSSVVLSGSNAASQAPFRQTLKLSLRPLCQRSARLEVAEGDRIAKLLDRRDAVLPLRPRQSLEEVGRTRLEHEADAFPSVSGFAPEAERTGRHERDADDLGEDAPVPVPADRRAGAVFGQEHVLQVCRGDPRERSGAAADGQQELRHVLDPVQAGVGEVVLPAERDDAPLATVALEFELLERQLSDSRDEGTLLLGQDQIGLVSKAGRKRGLRSEQVAAAGTHRGRDRRCWPSRPASCGKLRPCASAASGVSPAASPWGAHPG